MAGDRNAGQHGARARKRAFMARKILTGGSRIVEEY
jgi:hypothetical protein